MLDSIKSLVDIHIDGTSYNDSLFCQYYIHPNLEEKGILCHFSSAGIAKGPHQLEVERKYLKILPIFPDSLVSRRYVLPFIKVD
ncbi:MAG: hypothetical protein IPL49_16470 [Saprospirales bacterium]|nr:hypothetical protein [Saprospirales bacterium]MBK8492430.1 hypothetical protein [Saprospirales bacterium]